LTVSLGICRIAFLAYSAPLVRPVQAFSQPFYAMSSTLRLKMQHEEGTGRTFQSGPPHCRYTAFFAAVTRLSTVASAFARSAFASASAVEMLPCAFTTS